MQAVSPEAENTFTMISTSLHVRLRCRPRHSATNTTQQESKPHTTTQWRHSLQRQRHASIWPTKYTTYRRAHVQGHSWNRAVIPESTGSCRRSAWSTFPPLCWDQSSAGAVRETVYRRRPGLLSRRTNHLEQRAGQRDICPVSVDFRQRLKTFLFQASFPDIIIDPR